MYHCLTTLNSYISVKAKDKSEVDLYLDTYNQTMAHYKATGAFQQIELLLNIRQVFQEIRQNPERRDAILARKSVLQSLIEFLRKTIPHEEHRGRARSSPSNRSRRTSSTSPRSSRRCRN